MLVSAKINLIISEKYFEAATSKIWLDYSRKCLTYRNTDENGVKSNLGSCNVATT